MKRTNKKIFLTTTAIAAVVGITTVTAVSCGSQKSENLKIDEKKGLGNKNTKNGSKNGSNKGTTLSKKPTKVYPKGKNTLSDKEILDNLLSKFNGSFNVKPEFTKGTNGYIQTPMTVRKFNLTLDNMGMNALKSLKTTKDVKFSMNIVKGSQDDAKGTMKVSVNLSKGKETNSKEFEIKGFIKTKDVILDGNKLKSIDEIINELDRQIGLGFAKEIKDMTPQDLKDELEALIKDTNNGKITVIGKYAGKTSAMAVDKHEVLDKISKSIGDVKNVKRWQGYNGMKDSFGLGFYLLDKYPKKLKFGELTGTFLSYSTELAGGMGAQVAGLVGNMSIDFINEFPELLKIFKDVSTTITKLPMVTDWYVGEFGGSVITGHDLTSKVLMWLLRNGTYKGRK